MNQHLSSNVFLLAQEFDIPLTPGSQQVLDDETFERFKESYLKWSLERDKALASYLSSNSTLFRVYLPYNSRVFQLAAQVIWYLDEIVIRDPLTVLLENQSNDVENTKVNLRETLQFLNYFRDPIREGFVLLGGSSLLAHTYAISDTLIQEIFLQTEIREALKSATYCGYTTRPDSRGKPTGMFQIMLDSGGEIGWTNFGGEAGELSTPSYRMGEILPPVSHQELAKLLNRDPFGSMDHIFQKEIRRTLTSLALAHQLRAAIMFDREVDSRILSTADVSFDETRQAATAQVLNLTLPYLRGLQPDALQALRQTIPDAFIEFRARLFEIVRLSQGSLTAEELKVKIEREVIPEIRVLNSEMSSAVRKAKILSMGLPLISAVGVLAGWHFGIQPELLYVPALAGPGGALKSLANLASARAKLESHPFYFLWKASTSGGR